MMRLIVRPADSNSRRYSASARSVPPTNTNIDDVNVNVFTDERFVARWYHALDHKSHAFSCIARRMFRKIVADSSQRTWMPSFVEDDRRSVDDGGLIKDDCACAVSAADIGQNSDSSKIVGFGNILHGIAPDIEVFEDPKLVREGHDPQLEAGVQRALELLREHPLPSYAHPAYPDHKPVLPR